jgi:hypothetical protein
MPVHAKSQFRFSQYYVQDDGGWCAGISLALITHLYENLPDGVAYVMPAKAFVEAQQYVTLLKGTYNKITGRAEPWAQSFRQPIRNLQRPFDVGSSGSLPGASYEYTFATPGTAFLNLVVQQPRDTNYGNQFQSWYSLGGGSNHAGVAVWTPAREIFIFDPNCGGMLCSWQPCHEVDSVPTAIDKALELMYVSSDRMRGLRSGKLVSAQRPDVNTLPYGRV